MSLIHKLSSEALLAELDLFSVPPTQLSVEKSYETAHRPLGSLEKSTSISFDIPTSKEEYILLHETYFYAKIQLKYSRKDSKDVVKGDWKNVIPANNLLHSLINKCELKINDKLIPFSANAYSYRAYLETLLGFSRSAKDSHLTAALWYDSADERRLFFSPKVDVVGESAQVDLYGRLFTDMTFQGRAIPGGGSIKFDITLQPPSFSFQWPITHDLNIKMLDACLYLHRIRGSPQLLTAHAKALAISPAKYPINRTEIKQVIIQQGTVDAMLDNIVLGQLPRRMFLCFVSHQALSGSQLLDPFNFEPYDLSFAAVYLDGEQYPTTPYTPNFSENLYVREYMGLFQSLNQNGLTSTVNIGRDEFAANKMILGFNFTPDLSNGCGDIGHVNTIKRGSLRVYVQFRAPLKEIVNAIFMCEFDNIVEINNEWRVTSDYN